MKKKPIIVHLILFSLFLKQFRLGASTMSGPNCSICQWLDLRKKYFLISVLNLWPRLNPLISLSLHWLKVNERIEYKLLSLTYKVLTTARPIAIFTTLSLFNLLAVPAPHLLSLFLARQPSPAWKSQIAHLDMHHLVFGINFQIHSVSLNILVSIHLLIHFSTHLCHHPHSRHP